MKILLTDNFDIFTVVAKLIKSEVSFSLLPLSSPWSRACFRIFKTKWCVVFNFYLIDVPRFSGASCAEIFFFPLITTNNDYRRRNS